MSQLMITLNALVSQEPRSCEGTTFISWEFSGVEMQQPAAHCLKDIEHDHSNVLMKCCAPLYCSVLMLVVPDTVCYDSLVTQAHGSVENALMCRKRSNGSQGQASHVL